MFKSLLSGLHLLKTGTAGKRFQQRYHRRRDAGHSSFLKYVHLIGGGLIMLAGLFFMPAPGPGILILFLGATLVARESLLAAHGLDWTELRIRGLYSKTRRGWKSASLPVRILLAIGALALLAALAFASYKLGLPMWQELWS